MRAMKVTTRVEIRFLGKSLPLKRKNETRISAFEISSALEPFRDFDENDDEKQQTTETTTTDKGGFLYRTSSSRAFAARRRPNEEKRRFV